MNRINGILGLCALTCVFAMLITLSIMLIHGDTVTLNRLFALLALTALFLVVLALTVLCIDMMKRP